MTGREPPIGRFGGRLAALALITFVAVGSCRPAGPAPGRRPPAQPPRTEPAPPPVDEGALPLPSGGTMVRVGLAVDVDTVVVSGTGSPLAFEVTAPDGRVLHRGRADDRLLVVNDRGLQAITVSGSRVALPELATVRPAAGSVGLVMIDNATYRGAVVLRPSGAGRVTAVNSLDLEVYLLGVVPREIPATQYEAVKAQAVAARTYAVGQMGRRAALGFDFYATVADQVYGGASAENDVATRAVAETVGEILTYEGEPIDAFYHSTCGGRTAAIDEVWNHEPVPYLRSVSDEKPGGGHWCETSNRFRWTQEWSGEQLRAVLERNLRSRRSGPVRAVRDIEVVAETRSGRAGRTRVSVDDDSYLVRGDSIRWVLRTPEDLLLNSSLLLDIDAARSDGRIAALTVRGGGWGHGIGMCQIGAMSRAAAGHSYRDILAAYYQGTRLSRIY